jgi:predicted DCC family thiol-disulfide oxidoreductase YuxK
MNDRSTRHPLTLLFDGACPICRLEMDRLQAADAQQRLAFVDISVPGFDAERWGASYEEMMQLIHAARPDGSLVIGVEALALAYEAVGWGRWTLPLRLPLLAPLAGTLYAAFARNRYKVSALLAPWIRRQQARQALNRMQGCAGGRCATPTKGGSS